MLPLPMFYHALPPILLIGKLTDNADCLRYNLTRNGLVFH